jgi:hypothetical protein
MLSYLLKAVPIGLLYGLAGYVAGAFTPAVGRKIKSGYVALARKIVAKADSKVKAVEKKL